MKKIVFLLLLNTGFLLAQKKTIATIYGEKVQINTNSINSASNGLTSTNDSIIQLGGTLLKPTAIATTGLNTFAITGLQLGSTSDNVLLTDNNGILKSIPTSSLTAAGPNKGSLLSPKSTITITGGNNKLLDSDATVDITPGTAGQILVTDNTNSVRWGTIKDVKGLLVTEGSMSIVGGTIPFTNGIDYQRFESRSIAVTGPSKIIIRITLYTKTTQANERALGLFRIVDANGTPLNGETAITPFYLESKNYTNGNDVPVNQVTNPVPCISTFFGTINAPAAGNYTFHLECLLLGFSNYSDNVFKPTGKIQIGTMGSYLPYYSYEVYNQ